MPRSTLHIIWAMLMLGGISILYFFSLIIAFPVLLLAFAVIVIGAVLHWWLEEVDTGQPSVSRKFATWSYLVFGAGLVLLVNRGYYLTDKYGGWDAWALWNTHAKFLKDPTYWSSYLDSVTDFHPDYPLCLPATTGFVWNLFGTDSYLVPAAISAIICILIPALVFLELYSRNLLVAALALLWFVTDDNYIAQSLAQFADHLLALFFLSCFVCMHHFMRNKQHVKLLTVTGALVGLMMWTKNEGLMLALVFTVFQADVLLKRKYLKPFVIGLALPLLAYGTFKLFYAPQNDLVGIVDNVNKYLLDAERFNVILRSVKNTTAHFFMLFPFILAAYALACVFTRKLPGSFFLILLLCFACYMLVYQLTTHDLQWHLNTSLPRVMAQLVPSLIYITGLRFSEVKLPLLKKDEL